MNGTILGIVDKRIVYQNNSTKPNRNIFVVGGPGSYKTQSVVITNLFNETENSIVVTDPKGELYEKTAGIKLAQGRSEERRVGKEGRLARWLTRSTENGVGCGEQARSGGGHQHMYRKG